MQSGENSGHVTEPAMDESIIANETGSRKRFFNLSEDIWAVLIGAVLIMAVLATAFSVRGLRFTAPVYKWHDPDSLIRGVLSFPNLLLLAGIGVLFALVSAVAIHFSGGSVRKYLKGFAFIYLVGMISLVVAGNKTINYYGIEYVVFALLLGLLISNLTVLPTWLKEAARSEFFIKTGLVILGVSVLFTDIVKAGLPGILQAVLVVSVVWFLALWL